MDVGRGILIRVVARRWAFGVMRVMAILMLVLAVLVHILYISIEFALLRLPKNKIEGESPSQHHDADAEKQKKGPVSPNLTTCHVYVPDKPGFCVNCCPAKPESEEPYIDFQFPGPSSPLRLRRPAHLVDNYYIAKYREAVSKMKSLPSDDPRNFYRQANIHCAYCTGAYKLQNSDIPLNIHRSWLFFPWHRMMLYFHELILGDLNGDDCFALPFWNWDNLPGMVIPEIYMSGSLVDTNRKDSHLPPTVVELNFSLPEIHLDPEEQKKKNLALMYNQMVLAANTTELFMGCPYKAGEQGCCGTIECVPHNTVHDWTGSHLNPHRENMGVLYAAARDPIFYGHHGNVDRLWEIRRTLPEVNHSEINDTAWLDSYFFFHDERRQLVRIKIRDVVNITKLRYAYQKVDLPWLNMTSKDARDRLKMRKPLSSPISSADFEPHGLTLDTSRSVKVDRPQKHRSKKQKDFKEEKVMVVYGIHVKEDIYVKFDVFVNAVNVTDVDPEFIDFAGTFVHLPHGVWPAMMRKSSLKVGISALLQYLEADEDESIWVTLVPRANCMHVTIDGIRIE